MVLPENSPDGGAVARTLSESRLFWEPKIFENSQNFPKYFLAEQVSARQTPREVENRKKFVRNLFLRGLRIPKTLYLPKNSVWLRFYGHFTARRPKLGDFREIFRILAKIALLYREKGRLGKEKLS